MKRPRNGRYSDIGQNLAGEFPCLWIRVEGSYNRLTPDEAKQIGRLLIEQADWIQWFISRTHVGSEGAE